MPEPVSIYTVYNRNTKDYPGLFVCRRFDILPGQSIPRELVGTATTLEGIRAKVPSGLNRIPRYENDDPVILESWI